MTDDNLLKLSRENIRYLIKGLRYSLGYSLCDMGKVGLAKGLVGNWECGFCKPRKENLEILGNLIVESGKSYEELTELGKLNFGILIEGMAKNIGINMGALLRFVISKYVHVSDMGKLNKLKERKNDIAAKTKLILLQLKERIENNNKDARKIVFEIQKEATFSNLDNLKVLILVTEYLKSQKRLLSEIKLNYAEGFSSDWLHNRAGIPNKALSKIQSTYPDLLIKIEEQIKNDDSIIHKQWKRAEAYPEVVGFHYRNEQFEYEMFKLFEPICNNLIKNVLVADKNLNYITEIDLIGTYKDRKIYFMCKDCNKHQIANNRRIIKKNIKLVQEHLKPDLIFLVVSCNYPYDKVYFRDNKIFFIDKDDLIKIEVSKELSHIFSRESPEKMYGRINDLAKFRIKNKLSKIQLEALLGCSGYIYRRLNRDSNISTKNKECLRRLIKIKNIRELHFIANSKLALKNDRALILKYIRNHLGITANKIAKDIGTFHQYIRNLEHGRQVSKHLEKKIEDYLKSFKNFKLLKEKAKHKIRSQKEVWENAKSFDKIINFKGKPVNGDKLENDAAFILSSKGYLIFRNPILANEDLSFKKEVDIYALKDGKERSYS